MRKLTLLLFVSLFIFQIGNAQTGTITGKVVEKDSGFEVIGGNVLISGTTNGATTDLDGKYSFSVEPGTYTIECSYIGYETQKKENVEVKAGEVVTLDIIMGESAVALDLGVEVTARQVRNTESAAIAIQSKSPNLISVTSSAAFSKNGDNDVAAAVKRVTGVTVQGGKYVYVRGLGDRYSKTTLNGLTIPGLDPNRNTVQMDLFPTNLVDNIIVYKTFSPDLPGDFTGGLVDIATKDFPEEFNFNLSASTSYNTNTTFNSGFLTYQGGATDFLGFDDGSRALPAELDGMTVQDFPQPQFTGEISEADANQLTTLTNAFDNNWSMENRAPSLNHNIAASMGNLTQNKKLGWIAAVNHSRRYTGFDDGLTGIYKLKGRVDEVSALSKEILLNGSRGTEEVLWGAMLGSSYKINSNNKIRFNLMHNQGGESTAEFLEGRKYIDDADDLYQTRNWSYLQRSLSSGQVGGKHVFSNTNNLEVNWSSSMALSLQDQPDLRYFTNRVRSSGTRFIKASSDRTPNRFYRNMQQSNWDNKVDVTLPIKQWNGLSAKVKAGAAYVYKNREFRETRYTFNNQSRSVGEDINTFFDDVLTFDDVEGNYMNNGNGTYVINGYNPDNDYDAELGVTAGYVMTELPLTKKLRAIAGVRLEKTNLKFKTYGIERVLADFPQLDGQQNLLDNLDVLPSLNLNYEISDNMKVRSAYTRTLARPTFRELAPFASFDFDGGLIIIGNPELQLTNINNVDLRWEWYPKPGEMFTVGSFYKHFTNPIERTFNPEAPNGELTWRNVDKAFLAGAEVEWRKQLGFISALKDFTFTANFTYIYSRTDIDPAEMEAILISDPNAKHYREMYGQAPYVANALLSYKNETGWNSNLAFNVVGPRIVVTTVGATPNYYEKPFPSLNYNISKNVGNGFTLKLAANNLLNSKFKIEAPFKGENYPVQVNSVGMTFSVGVSYKIP